MTSTEPIPLGHFLKRSPRYGINAAAITLAPGIPTYLRITDIDEFSRFSPNPKVGVSHPSALHYRLQQGELVVARTGASVGKSYLYNPRDGELIYAGFLINLAPDPERLSPKFLSLILQSKPYWDWIARTSVRSGQPGVNGRELATFPLAAPAIEVQNSIADAVSGVDELITILERLIAKKQAIKTGVMQQLLTGQTRLPGFEGDWEPQSVASRSVLKARIGWQGLKTTEYRSSGTYRLVGGTEFSDGRIDWDSTPFVDKWRFEQDEYIKLRPGDVLLTKDGSIGKTAFVDRLPGPATLNSGVFVIRPVAGSYDPRFFYFMLRSRAFEEFLSRLTAGSTISHLYQRDLVTLQLVMPPTVEEQTAIAEVLSTAEDEVRLLEERLQKAQRIKAGMMQQLLTGRTRLPVEAAS